MSKAVRTDSWSTDKLFEQFKDVDSFLISISNRQNSGWILDGTENSSKPLFKDCPTRKYIPSTGRIAVKGEDGKVQYLNARYIAGCPYLLVSEQKEYDYAPNQDPSVDKLYIDTIDRGASGMMHVMKEGDLSKFYYLYLTEYNNSAPVRPSDTKGLYQILDLSKQIETASEPDFYLTDALYYVDSLVQRVGTKVTSYDEKKIDSYCTLLALSTTREVGLKFKNIRDIAKSKPKQFIELVSAYEDTSGVEVEQAIDLNVIKIDGKTAVIDSTNSVIMGGLTGKADNKVKQISNFLLQPENKDLYETIKVLLKDAKNKELQNV